MDDSELLIDPPSELPPAEWWQGRFTRMQFDSMPDRTFNAFLLIYRSMRCKVPGYGFTGDDRATIKAKLYDVAADADFAEYLATK